MSFQGPVIFAQKDVATVFCLGADAVVSLIPKSGFPDIDMTMNPSSNAARAGSISHKSKDIFKVTLVHGDLLILTGDDFEVHGIILSYAITDKNYQTRIQRTGTTIRMWLLC